jgi:hypothetical protein
MALEGDLADVQGLRSMELGGFEPPTSWERSGVAAKVASASKRLFAGNFIPLAEQLSKDVRFGYARICGDVIRVGNFWRQVPEIAESGSRYASDSVLSHFSEPIIASSAAPASNNSEIALGVAQDRPLEGAKLDLVLG